MIDEKIEISGFWAIIPWVLLVCGSALTTLLLLDHFVGDKTREMWATSQICGPVCRPGAKARMEFDGNKGFTCFCQEGTRP